MRLARLFLALGLLLPIIANAHEGRPLLIKLAQQADNLTLKWQAPPVLPPRAEPLVSLVGCTLVVDQSHPAPTHGLAGQATYTCPSGWATATARIEWPTINPALATLVEIKGGQTRFYGPEQTQIPLSDLEGAGTDFPSFIATGVEHILAGFDHLLFIMALTLIVWLGNTATTLREKAKRLGLMVTGFTLAHSLTLGLATFNLVALPAAPVEASIALSILFVCVELARAQANGQQDTLTWRYPALTASAFGLLHGLGFATVLADAGLGDSIRWLGLLGFNIGVELGQVFFVALIILAGILLARLFSASFLARGQTLMIYGMGTLSAAWMFERIGGF